MDQKKGKTLADNGKTKLYILFHEKCRKYKIYKICKSTQLRHMLLLLLFQPSLLLLLLFLLLLISFVIIIVHYVFLLFVGGEKEQQGWKMALLTI